MEAIKISVHKQMDGYTFSIEPSVRQQIRSWFPNSHPANNIFISYDIKSNFEVYSRKLETFIYPVLLGVDKQSNFTKKLKKFCLLTLKPVNVLHTHKVTA